MTWGFTISCNAPGGQHCSTNSIEKQRSLLTELLGAVEAVECGSHVPESAEDYAEGDFGETDEEFADSDCSSSFEDSSFSPRSKPIEIRACR